MSSKNSYSSFIDGTGSILKVVSGFVAGVIYKSSSGTVGVNTGASHSRLNTFEGS
jgi:hypothetical protein